MFNLFDLDFINQLIEHSETYNNQINRNNNNGWCYHHYCFITLYSQ